MRKPENNYLFVFLHIPKCGGTSLNAFLERLFKGAFRKYHPRFDEHSKLSPLEAQNTMCLSSHVPYPLHKRYTYDLNEGGAQSELHSFEKRKCLYFTVLRDPIERLISYYNFVINWPIHHHYEKLKDYPINDFFEYLIMRGDPEIQNLMTKLLMGNVSKSARFECDEVRDFVCKNYWVVASLDKLSLLEELLIQKTGNNPKHSSEELNVSIKKSSQYDLTPEILSELIRLNEEDQKFYSWINKEHKGFYLNQSEPGL